MTFGEAVKSGFDHYTKFDGRAGRPAYWWWFLFAILVAIGANIIDAIIGSFGVVSGIAALALLLPGLSVFDSTAARHRPHWVVGADRPDPDHRVHRAAHLLPAPERSGCSRTGTGRLRRRVRLHRAPPDQPSTGELRSLTAGSTWESAVISSFSCPSCRSPSCASSWPAGHPSSCRSSGHPAWWSALPGRPGPRRCGRSR